MNIELRELTTRKAICMTHIGPFPLLGETFGKLCTWMGEREFGQSLALFYSDPQTTPEAELRSDAGFFVPDTYPDNDPQVHLVQVEGGPHSVGTFVGSYDGLSAAWGEFMTAPLPEGYTHGNQPPFEVYVSMGEEPGGADSVTELCMPLKRL